MSVGAKAGKKNQRRIYCCPQLPVKEKKGRGSARVRGIYSFYKHEILNTVRRIVRLSKKLAMGNLHSVAWAYYISPCE